MKINVVFLTICFIQNVSPKSMPPRVHFLFFLKQTLGFMKIEIYARIKKNNLKLLNYNLHIRDILFKK